ncbi:hypothetical protein [Marinobacterium mangrovicola]|uniref:PilX-like prepilin protein n=1 Tax=Marinobacterium mangrovicola TaxID=1476959 RepID=A0A4R1GND4_9GAMM|nr:hypothetical protein [Marinobacterium mangrovicola]TCK05942.1 hypothetical protein CLV83_2884 [Marinobacterium mangrovicola]
MTTKALVTPKYRQQGMATLVTAVVLLIAVLGVLFYMSGVVNRETQLVANEYRGKQAFHAAQGGIDRGIYEIQLQQTSAAFPVSRSFDVASYGYMADLVSGAEAEFSVIRSEGYSDDSSTQRILYQVLAKNPLFPSMATIPLVAKGNATLSGTFELINNDENINVWTGGGIDKNGAFQTKIMIDGQPNQISTTKNTIGPDVIHSDPELASATKEEMLVSLVGYSLAELKGMAGSNVYADEMTRDEFNSAVANSSTGVIYYTDDSDPDKAYGLPSNTTIGTEDSPVILVVDGSLDIQANSTFYGLIISTKTIEKINGGPYIYGGIIGLEDADIGNGNFTIENSPGVSDGFKNRFVLSAVNGGWRDWEL